MTLSTTGRTDLDNLFRTSPILEGNLAHTPFLVFVEDDGDWSVRLVSRADELVARFAPDAPVMVQWAGRWSSDFFRMTVADVARGLEERAARRARAQSRNCSSCGIAIDSNGHFSREADGEWLKICRDCVEAYDRIHGHPARGR